MKLGVLTFNFYPLIGGSGRRVYEIYVKGLSEDKGLDITYISPYNNSLPGNLAYFGFTHKLGKHVIFSLLINFFLDRIVQEENIEKLDVHSGPGGVFLIKKPKGCQVIVTVHHTYYQTIKYVKGEAWKSIFLAWERRTYKLADQIIVISRSTQKALTENYGIPPEKIEYIPNGVDLRQFYPLQKVEKIPHGILFVGRLEKRKGIDFLLKAVNKALKKNPSLTLSIAGRGSLLPWCKWYIKENNFSSKVSFLEYLSNEELNRWYNRSSLVVVPSAFEGFGFPVIEAMAAGTPVIATNVDGIKDIIKNKYNGFLVEYPNVDELAVKINNVLNKDNPKVVENAFKAVKGEFNIEQVILGTQKIMKEK